MKTIEVSDKDYDILMELSKELQLQDNYGNAFPYFWEPSSIRQVPDEVNGNIVIVFDHDQSETYSLLDYVETHDSVLHGLIGMYDYVEEQIINGLKNEESFIMLDTISYIKHFVDNADVYYEREERITEHNPSLFLSDVKQFCNANKHHLAKDPKPYARTLSTYAVCRILYLDKT